MADIFISYCRDDRPKAEQFQRALADEGLDVWWDAGLKAGEIFDEKVQQLLHSVKAVVVLWTPAAVESEWVRGEGMIGRERGVLVPVMIKKTVIPVPFNLIQAADLTHWNGDRADPAYRDVVERLKQITSSEHVPLQKPIPNRAVRQLWTAIAAVAVIAIGGASVWFLRPWEWVQTAMDPVVQAQKKREANIAKLAAFGIQPNDFELYDWQQLATRRFNQNTFDALKTEAETGSGPALALLCTTTYWGAPNRPSDDAQAFDHCRKGADLGDPAAQLYYGIMLRERAFLTADDRPEQKRNNEAAAAEQIKKASDQKFGPAMVDYGFMLMNGEGGVAPDPAHAVELFKAAQDKGLPAADFAMGDIVGKGYVPGGPNPVESARLTKLAADKGFMPAVYRMGDMYRDGYGVTEDLQEAMKYYQIAASQTDDKRAADRAAGMVDYMKRRIAEEKNKPPPSPLDPLQPPSPN